MEQELENTEHNTQKTESKSIRNLECHTTNPFKKDLLKTSCVQPRKVYHRENKDFTNLDGGEIINVPIITGDVSYFWKDTCSFVKFYNTKENMQALSSLSKSAMYLLTYIMTNLKPNSDIIKVSQAEYCEFSNTSSKGSYYAGIIELVEKDFLAKISNDVYYINYTKFCNGVRTEFLGGASTAEDAYYEKYGKKS